MASVLSLTAPPRSPFRMVETSFEAMAGFAEDDHREALAAFRRSAQALVDGRTALRPAVEADEALRRLCRDAVAQPCPGSLAEARRFFETRFKPYRIETDGPGFLTGYYEPEVEGSLEPSASFTAPILRRPSALGRIGPGVADHPYRDRAAIEAGIGTAAFEPVVWLRDWVEVFFIHVQGSARITLPDGGTLRLVYDGRNGQPYTSIGRLLVERGEIAAADMSLDSLKRWIRDHGQEIGAAGRVLMQSNRSYIFFRAEADAEGEGPIGGAGAPLSCLRSIALDRTIWPYGLPFFIEAHLPWRRSSPEAFGRLVISQDTGSAILGPARADLFFGTGEEAGRRAGDIRHMAAFTVLLPRDRSGGA